MSETPPRLPKIQSRKEFMDHLAKEISAPKSEGGGEPQGQGRLRELKAYVIEANSGIPKSAKSAGAKWEMVDTGLDKMKIMRTDVMGTKCEFYADVSDKRFHTLHTTAKSGDAARAVAAITSMDGLPLDRMWLSDSLLKALANRAGGDAFRGFGVKYASGFPGNGQAGSLEDLSLSVNGSLASEIEEHIRKNPHLKKSMAYGKIRLKQGEEADPYSYVHDEIDKEGHFAVKRGKSVQDHLYLVNEARALYETAINEIEECRLGSSQEGGRWTITGNPLYFEFDEPMQDLRRFITRLFDSTKPFRLWGLESEVEDGYYNVAGIDFHTGDPINFEITSDMMRVYLSEESCGNTIMRLLCNLQDRFGTRIRCKQVDQVAGV